MTGGDDSSDVQPPWHERTSTVLGASVAALAVIAVLFQLGSCVTREYGDPGPAPQYFVDPDFSSASSASSAATTTQTITSTLPPITTDINPGVAPPPGPPTSSTETSTSGSSPTRRTPRTRESTEDDDEPTTTRRPRFNETRTLNP